VHRAALVLKDKVKVDKLVTLSINNFPALLELRDQRLTAQQRLARSDPNWQSLLDALADVPRIPLQRAWKEQREAFKQRTEDQSRHRTVPTRTAADAAGTSIAAGEADARAALALHSVTDRPAPLRDGGAHSPSRIVRILHANKHQYKVLWSQPEGSPAVTQERRSRLDSRRSTGTLYWHGAESSSSSRATSRAELIQRLTAAGATRTSTRTT
jgi:hypothetical protein